MINEALEIEKEETPEGVKFILKGRVDSINADLLQKYLDEVLSGGQINVVLNMFRIGYLCSIGIRVILNAYKTAKDSGGTLGIEQPSENVKKVLAITSLDEILII